jgi:hypothetical protein
MTESELTLWIVDGPASPEVPDVPWSAETVALTGICARVIKSSSISQYCFFSISKVTL